MTTPSTSVLIIYTGGTIGMTQNPETGALEPFDFSHLLENVPELGRLGYSVSTIQFDPIIDSSETEPSQWVKIVRVIAENYDKYDGFVVLHGTDTMAYTASAVSFMLENLGKPVIFTGSQLPIGMLRTDGKENLITAIEIAADRDEKGNPRVPEVCIFFDNTLMRGNRTCKVSAQFFNAFVSPNYPLLAHVGININYDDVEIHYPNEQKPLIPHYEMDNNVVILKLFPGINRHVVHQALNIPGVKGVVLESFGSGNAPRYDWFLDELRNAVQRGIVIVNVTQCSTGSVQMELYRAGNTLRDIGVISGYDSTTESALAKLMFLFGQGMTQQEVIEAMRHSYVGEVTLPRQN
ncbi:MAG: type I asparaginase [Bacteroidaceae bacterium]|nr:type I asparaginase [Bacteroidaceae bacterium]